MPQPPNGSPDSKRDPINVDYRFLSLLLVCTTRADLLKEYITDQVKAENDPNRWATLRQLGLPERLLKDSFYLFNDPATQSACRQLQLVTQTLVSLNDYCELGCPSGGVLTSTTANSAMITRPLQQAGVED